MSRKISDLHSSFREKALLFQHACDEEGLQVLIYCTLRTVEQQARLYRKGRSFQEIQNKAVELKTVYRRPDLAKILLDVGPQKSKTIVTWAGPGQSLHNYGLAFDGCPTQEGKLVWAEKDPEDDLLWLKYGDVAKSFDLVWAGNWKKSKREFPHVQMPDVHWRDLIRIGPSGF